MKYIYICIYIYGAYIYNIYMGHIIRSTADIGSVPSTSTKEARWKRIALGGGKALYFHSFQCLQVYSGTCSTGVQETILGVLQTCLKHFGENWKIALRCSKLVADLFYNHNSIAHTSLSGSWKRPEHNDWSYIDSILRLCSKGTGRPVQQPQWYCPHESTQELSKKNSIRFVHGI